MPPRQEEAGSRLHATLDGTRLVEPGQNGPFGVVQDFSQSGVGLPVEARRRDLDDRAGLPEAKGSATSPAGAQVRGDPMTFGPGEWNAGGASSSE